MSSTNKTPRQHPLHFLIGTWRGKGQGKYPNIPSFEYTEQLTITPDEANRGWLYYKQQTWNPAKNNANFHSEMGYLRTPPPKIATTNENASRQTVELILAQPTGIASIEHGFVDGTNVILESTGISRSASAKPPFVVAYKRVLNVDSGTGELKYRFDMETEEKEMQVHLEAVLVKGE